MNCETLFRLLLLVVLFTCSSAQAWDWAKFDIIQGSYLSANTYFDFYVTFIAGRTYNIFVLGMQDLNTTITATDPSGYQGFNDDWGGSYYADGIYYRGSSSLDFTPTTSGPTRLRTQAAIPGASGQFYLYVTEQGYCSASCTSKFLG